MLASFIKTIKSIVDAFSAVCAFLLIRLWLWIPALYSALFIIICVSSGITLAGDIVLVFFAGLIFAFAASLGILIYRGSLKTPKISKSRTENAKSNMAGVKLKAENTTSDQIPIPAKRKKPLAFDIRPQPMPEDYSDLEQKYFEKQNQEPNYNYHNYTDYKYSEPQSYTPPAYEEAATLKPHDDYLLRQRLEKRLQGTMPQETPMIFATRKDPDVLIYEYSDRLQYYKKRKEGLVLIKTEYKD